MSDSGSTSPGSPQVPVLVLGEGITGLGVLRTLAKGGTPLYVAGAADSLIKNSRWYRPLPGHNAEKLCESTLPALLKALDIPRMVLLPCSDAWATAVSGLDPILAARFPASVPAPDILKRLVDKGSFAETLERMGLPHPRTVVLRDERAIGSMPDEFLRDYFLKPTRSRPFAAKYRLKGLRMHDWAQVHRMLAETREMDLGLMLQEFIPGPPTNHYFLDGFMDRHGRISAMFARRRLRMFPLEFGNSTATESVALEEVRGAEATLRSLLEGIRYRGIFSAEFKLDGRDGLFKILEVNARPWWFVAFAANCGVDVCHMAYRDALGEDVKRVRDYRIGRRCVYPRRDLENRRARPAQERPSLVTMLRSWVGAEQLTFSWSDPRPGLREIAARSRSRLRRKLRWRPRR